MTYLIYILKIILYFVFVFFNFMIFKKYNKNNKKIPFFVLLFLCIVYGGYTIICGQNPPVSDRGNYIFQFEEDRYLYLIKNQSLGLYWLYSILHLFTYNPYILLLTVSSLYLILTYIGYSKYDEVSQYALLLLGLTPYFSYGFYLFKQCIAIGFIGIAFAYFLKEKKIKTIFFTVLAILFHEAAWIAIPLFFTLKSSKNIFLRIFEYLILLLCCLFFVQINRYIIDLGVKIVPSLAIQLDEYLNGQNELRLNINYITAFKGFPFYITFIYAIIKRKELKDKIKNYDKYTMLVFFVSITNILSMYMYWMYRFGALFYLPTCIFSILLLKESKRNRNFLLYKYGLYISSFLLTVYLISEYYFRYGGF